MDPYAFIFNNAPKGALIFSNYKFSLTEYFNPSYDKHVSIYIGSKDDDIFSCKDNKKYVVESLYNNGVTITSLSNYLKDVINVKVLVLDDDLNPNSKYIMSLAADIAKGYVGTPYGFGKNNIYCFKLIAKCYELVGIELPTYKILGKRIYLSQSFTDNKQWKKIYDSNMPSFYFVEGQ
ncbi:NlpC P60 superfamily protein [Brazilian porcupinepox virus 1]|nr:NlpC P60 superfamily protein [Brazilian porcupinepox virus 1]